MRYSVSKTQVSKAFMMGNPRFNGRKYMYIVRDNGKALGFFKYKSQAMSFVKGVSSKTRKRTRKYKGYKPLRSY